MAHRDGFISTPWRWLERRLGWAPARVLAGSLVGALLATTAWWWSNPGVLHDGVGSGFRTSKPVGETLYVGIGWPVPGSTGSIRVSDLAARVRVNSSDARISYLVCRVNHRGVGAIGTSTAGRLEEDCHDTAPVDGADVSLGSPLNRQVLMAVQPTRPGRVVIDGVDLHYWYGWRRGKAVSGPEVTVRTR